VDAKIASVEDSPASQTGKRFLGSKTGSGRMDQEEIQESVEAQWDVFTSTPLSKHFVHAQLE
jgi:hypothetical protein